MKTLKITSAHILSPADGFDFVGDVYIEDGKIKKVAAHISDLADEIIDGTGLILSPGLVDMHVHLRDPGFAYKEDIKTAARAAAAGGVTSVVAMPNTKPFADSPAVIEDILTRSENADVRVYQTACATASMSSKEICDLPALKEAGAAAFSDDGRPIETNALLLKTLKQAKELDIPVLCHCEDLSLAAGGIINEGAVSKKLSVKGIPPEAEDAAVAATVAVCETSGLPVHICHVSTKTSLAIIRDAKRRGAPVTCETAPHYFLLDETALLSRNADFRMNPPLGTTEDRDAVIEAIRDRTVDVIATDHAPHSEEDKADFERAPNGVVGLETSLSAGITALVKPGVISIARLIELMSVSPAKIMKIEAGSIKPGSRADVVLFSDTETYMVSRERLHGKSKNTPFDGMSFTGRVFYTVNAGRIVYKKEW